MSEDDDNYAGLHNESLREGVGRTSYRRVG